jgi:uncharacterized protein involved in exopolysaccharide biosynthesis
VESPAELGHRSKTPSLTPLVSIPAADGDTSIFDFATVVLRNLGTLVGGMVLGGSLALLPLSWTEREYQANASFTPQGADAPRSGITALAGQFGIAIPTTHMNQSPQFYADLLRSRVILAEFARDTFVVAERGNARLPFTELFEVAATSPEARAEAAAATLGPRVQSKINITTGTVSVTVRTPWRSVSMAITEGLLERVNSFNLEKRQSQASNERRFVEGRLNEARGALREAEDRFQSFLASNRQAGSPLLTLSRDRLQREVTLRQDVVATLTQSYEDVRIREVRDTPVITIIEPPGAPTRPVSRRVAVRLVVGVFLGGFLALLLTLMREMFARRRSAGDPHVEQFSSLISQFRNRIFRRSQAEA